MLDALGLYGIYLQGQAAGMSDALSLPSIVAAFQIEGIARHRWADMTQLILRAHARAMRIHKIKRKGKK